MLHQQHPQRKNDNSAVAGPNRLNAHGEWHICQPGDVAIQPIRPNRLTSLPQQIPQLTGRMAAVTDAKSIIGRLQFRVLTISQIVDRVGADR